MITVAEFTRAVRFFTHNSDVGLFLFWFRLVMMCTFWGTSDCSCICWVRIVSYFSLFAECPMLFRWTNWRSILCYKWVVVKFNSDPLLNVAGALFRRLVRILMFCLDPFLGRNLLFVLASRLILQNCSRDGKCLYYLTKWRIFYWYVLSELICHLFEEVVFFKNGFCMYDSTLEGLFCFDILHITDVWRSVLLTFDSRFWSIAVPSNWKSSAVLSFSIVCFVETCFVWRTGQNCFDTFLSFFTNISFSGQYLRFCCVLVFAFLSGVDQAVFRKSLSLVSLVGLFFDLRDVTGLFHLTNRLSLDWLNILTGTGLVPLKNWL